MNNHNFSDKKPRNNPWLFLFVFVTSLLGVTSCQNNNSSSNQSNSLSKDSLTKINIENAIKVGKLIGERAAEKAIKLVAFDKGGHKYHGIIKALAEEARKNLNF